jgi:hypothetical protein
MNGRVDGHDVQSMWPTFALAANQIHQYNNTNTEDSYQVE